MRPCIHGLLGVITASAALWVVVTTGLPQPSVLLASMESVLPRPPVSKPAALRPWPASLKCEVLAAFDPHRAMEVVRHLSEEIGPRPTGSPAELRAAQFIASRLLDTGWHVRVQRVRVPGTALTTHNLIATRTTSPSGRVVVVGAHYDSYGNRCLSPGADDNASGVGVLLEACRVLSGYRLPYQLRLVFFGGEEVCPSNPRLSRVGSRHYVEALSAAERSQILAMICVDMVGAGTRLCAGRAGYGSDRARQWLLASADRLGLPPVTVTCDPTSDHLPFEAAGIPSVLLTRTGGPERKHTPHDLPAFVSPTALAESGRLLLRFLLTAADPI